MYSTNQSKNTEHDHLKLHIKQIAQSNASLLLFKLQCSYAMLLAVIEQFILCS